MERKYRLSQETKILPNGTVLHRVIPCKNFYIETKEGTIFIRKGIKGGWVESETNLSHNGTCWVDGEAMVYNNARVCDDAYVRENAVVKDYAKVCENAVVGGCASISNDSVISGKALVKDSAVIKHSAIVSKDAVVKNYATIKNRGVVYGRVTGNAVISDRASVLEESLISDNAFLGGRVRVKESVVEAQSVIKGRVFLDNSFVSRTVDENLFVNYFNNKRTKCGLKDFSITDKTKKFVIVPASFPKRIKDRASFAFGENSICFHLTSESLDIKQCVAKNYETFIPLLLKTLDFDLTNIPSSFHLMLFSYIKNCKNLDFLADNFISTIKKTNSKNVENIRLIEEKEEKISFFARSYVFAQIISFFIWNFSLKSSKVEPVPYNRYRSFLEKFINISEIDIVNKEIISINDKAFAWNEEMIHMVSKVCKFSPEWEKEQSRRLVSLGKKIPSVKIYCN